MFVSRQRLWFAAGFAIVAALIALDLFYGHPSKFTPIGTAQYAGSATCAACHEQIHADYLRTGHPLKIQKIDGKPPVYPPGTSGGVPQPPPDLDWSDISYVIGGYGWKARFMDRQGYILTGKQNRQFNLANDTLSLAAGWSGYEATSAPRKPYTCGACHTTGWTKTGINGPHQNGLPGIHGTWREAGVTCEACHGPASAHVANPTRAKLTIKPNCRSCHARGDVKQIDAIDGLIKHHEQYEELLASAHRSVGCLGCHAPHKSTKYNQGGFKGEQSTCLACHQRQRRLRLAPIAHRDCTSCHMPFVGSSAVAISTSYKGGVLRKGDVRSHIYRINPSPDWNMFTDDGRFVRLDGKGRAHLTTDYACLGCHVTKDRVWAAQNAPRIHADR